MSGRRQALQPFAFSDGTALNKGDWVCTPAAAVMQRETDYPEASEFRGFRFVSPKDSRRSGNAGMFGRGQPSGPSGLTDVHENWHVWGIGRITCPGRFYAAAAIKSIMAQLIRNYDMELEDRSRSRAFTWRSSMIPRHNRMVILQARK